MIKFMLIIIYIQYVVRRITTRRDTKEGIDRIVHKNTAVLSI